MMVLLGYWLLMARGGIHMNLIARFKQWLGLTEKDTKTIMKFSNRSKEKMTGVHPDLVHLCYEVLKKTDIDFGIICGLRTQEEQDKRFAQGRSTPGKVITWTRNSKHITGHAIDFMAYKNGKVVWDQKLYDRIGKFFVITHLSYHIIPDPTHLFHSCMP